MKIFPIKTYIVTFISLFAFGASFSQEGYNSKDNSIGSWSDVATWNKSQPWLSNTPGSNVGGATAYANIYGKVTHSGNLTLGGASAVTVYDTLWIDGNMNVSSGSKLTVENSGVLIVTGNFNASGGTVSTNDGRIVVKGDLSATEGAGVNNNAAGANGFYVYNAVTRSGGAAFNGSSDPAAGNFQNEAALAANDPSLYELVNGGTLPVEFLYVKAELKNNGITIKWATASELNNDYFTVERSDDGVNFSSITTVAGAGNSDQQITYEITDRDVLSGTSYYRIKQTDYDGKFDYSTVIAVNNETELDTKLVMGPNPATHIVHVDIHNYGTSDVMVKITNDSGLTVYEADFDATFNHVANLDVSSLPRGFYLVSVSGQANTKTSRLLLQ